MIDPVYKKLPIEDISLDVENPRIKNAISWSKKISDKTIAMALANPSSESQNSYNTLKDSIFESKRIIHPIVVNKDEKGNYLVIEGNTRLQIYRDFASKFQDGTWDTIPCLIYEKLTEEQIHEIRLNSHLVGTREWDPFSKAKYLFQLSQTMGTSSIIAMCGGNASEIHRSINAYNCMVDYYVPIIESEGDIPNPREFSKFVEYEKIKSFLMTRGITDEKFSKWVVDGKIDNAQKVRVLPEVLRDNEAYNIFLSKGLSAAEKCINSNKTTPIDPNKVSLIDLCVALRTYIGKITLDEVKKYANNCLFLDDKNKITLLAGELNELIEDIEKYELDPNE